MFLCLTPITLMSTEIEIRLLSLNLLGQVIERCSPCPRHESMCVVQKYSFRNFYSRHLVEVSGQLHIPAALLTGNEPLVPTD